MTVINFFRKRLDVIIILSLFNFVFLGSEYLFDNNAARVTSETGVVTAQSYILAASVVGFLLFSFLLSYPSPCGRSKSVPAGPIHFVENPH